jgi:Trypsin-like peptidase domain
VRFVSSTSAAVSVRRRLSRLGLALAVAGTVLLPAAGSALAQEPEPPGTPPAAPNSLIDPAVLESLQASIVGLVTIWEEPEDPFGGIAPDSGGGTMQGDVPVMTICTGWFDSPTTIATAGHCVDPEQGRLAIDQREGPSIDPTTGEPTQTTQVRPEPKRTVWAFQPRELPGAVITSPIIVRVDSFRSPDEGDTAKLEMYGMPPAKPLAIAPAEPRLGETVTSIGFPGLNIDETDGVNLGALVSGGKTPAEVLQDSRLQPVNTSGTITARQFRQGVAVYQINADLAEGISGGPTVNSRGEVLGVNSQMTVPFLGQNFNVITDTGMLREFLGHGPARLEDGATNAPSRLASESDLLRGGLSTGWVIMISVIAGAVLGGVGMWAFQRSRNGSTPGPAAEESDPSPANT